MPVVFTKQVEKGIKIGVWKIAEEESFFLEKMPLSEPEGVEFQPLKGIRRLEWLACRWLLHEISGHDLRMPIAKDAFSKPFFPENEDLVFSLSHSRGTVAALLCDLKKLETGTWILSEGTDLRAAQKPKTKTQNPKTACGCDLQKIVEKMARLAPKFINQREMAFVKKHDPETQFDLFHFFWTAKESLYKAWGKRGLDFRKEMRLEPFVWDADGCEAVGHIRKSRKHLIFRVLTEKIMLPDGEEFVLTFCLQKG